MQTQSLVESALLVLNTEDPIEKARIGEDVASRWLQGSISLLYPPSVDLSVPDRPARLSNVRLVPPNFMPKLGKCGSLRSRQAVLHSLVHTESWAIDLSWDIIARFGKPEAMPMEFFTDFVKVAQDEGRHFTLLHARLLDLGSFYGAFPVHDGLWESATVTSKNLLARLAVEHCVHEARGLDVLPSTIMRFRNGGDDETADLLETVVYPEEITHCASGVKWFKYLCSRRSDMKSQNLMTSSSHSPFTKFQQTGEKASDEADIISTFHSIIRSHFKGPLKPPFNKQAREAAGFGPQWYEPLTVKEDAVVR